MAVEPVPMSRPRIGRGGESEFDVEEEEAARRMS